MSDKLDSTRVATDQGSREDPRTFLFRLTLIASIGGLLFGLDTGVIAGALVYLRDDFNLTAVSEGLVVTSLLFPGATAGALLGGPIADRLGRRKSLVIAGFIFIVSTIVCALAPTVAILVAGRIALGYAVGVASVVVPLYLAEMAPASQRGRIVTMNQLMITVGLFLAFVLNALLANLVDSSVVWRYMIGIAAIPAVALFFGMLALPDTPRWYASKQRWDEAKNVLRRAHMADRVEAEYKQISAIVEDDQVQGKVSVLAVLRNEPWMKRLIMVGIVLAVAQQTTGINVVMYYAPTVLETSGLTRSAALLASVTVGIAMILFTIIGMWILGIMGRRKMMLFGFVGVAVSHFGLLITYMLPETTVRSYLILLFMLSVTGFMVTFLGTTGFLVLSELFPLPIRGFAMGASLGGLWIANSLISFLFPILAERFGSVVVFGGFMVLNVLAALFAFRFIPETKGRTLEEVEVEMRARGTASAASS
ncbi:MULTISPECIES: sugar porter family MFS transporter [unclassified Rhodococcus (in: high G+C Gram-positive bacteria)]|uniref:sugar porter family MFS transporter n=1 Tax=unclassified Rhodococcus (in: high G+C Gram-positive bacteria) TaxID=192944 RepID=UPI00211AD883|nr:MULTISPECIES: sugar porter family MFS transporter [unclassified Rhodococcus (in: high G+C Gram-positive bacteria)]